MTTAKFIRYSQTGLWLMEKQTADLTHEQSLLVASPHSNCLNWVVGHLVVYRQIMLQELGGAADSPLEPEVVALYQRGSARLTAATPGLVLFAQLVALFQHSQPQLEALLEQKTADDWATIYNPKNGQTLGERMEFLQWHEAYHSGQLEFGRQLAGYGDVVIR